MNFAGLVTKYPVNVPVFPDMEARQFLQKQPMAAHPASHSGVIRMNATYLEMVDNWYEDKGMFCFLALGLLVISAFTLWVTIQFATPRPMDPPGELSLVALPFIAVFLSIAVLSLLGAVHLVRKDVFGYTHYPTRFNRKTGMVHAFRSDGTVLSAPWRDIVFVPAYLGTTETWEMRGHLLSDDQSTIIDTFALYGTGALYNSAWDKDRVKSSSVGSLCFHWEFIRRYMEEGPQAVQDQVPDCVPSDVRDTDTVRSAAAIFDMIDGAPLIWYCVAFPFCLVVSLMRTIGTPVRALALRYSKLPQWPDEIEASCVIEPDDPYAFEGDEAGTRVALYPDAARTAGVVFAPRPSEKWGTQQKASAAVPGVIVATVAKPPTKQKRDKQGSKGRSKSVKKKSSLQ